VHKVGVVTGCTLGILKSDDFYLLKHGIDNHGNYVLVETVMVKSVLLTVDIAVWLYSERISMVSLSLK